VNDEKETSMKTLVVLVVLVGMIAATLALGAVNTYQVTGPVLALTTDAIVVQKGREKWELARDAGTKVAGDLKVGSKVTIEYRMTAATVTVKEESAASGKKK
jgi:creatinine amidohydrolase/Fe(II)-dependent formamide hydrolase-like protein